MRVRDMTLLLRVAETGSMTRAATLLSLSPAAVSAAVQRIEESLGLRVFERTTRALRPTAEGLILLEGCAETTRRWQQAVDEARGSRAVLEGLVRVAAPSDTTYQVVAEAVAEFAEAHPKVRVVLQGTDMLQDVLGDALDLSIRYGALQDSSLVARRLTSSPRVLVASPDYLARAGHPASIESLAGHRLLSLQLRNTLETSWAFVRDAPASPHRLELDSPLCGDGLAVRRWAVAGRGIAFKALIDVIDDLEEGRLAWVLPAERGEAVPLYAVLPSRAYVPARVRSLLEALARRFEARSQRCQAWVAKRTV